MTERVLYPLYGSTFTLHRASPLYHGSNPLLTNLDKHARRLRETLVGDESRGFGLQDSYLGTNTHGALDSCEWKLLGDEKSWENAQEDIKTGDAHVITTSEARGVQIDLHFEKAKHLAILLGDPSRISSTPGFTTLPLVLFRMPAPLREIVINFLSTTFDTRVSSMRLRPSFLTNAVEKVLDAMTAPDAESPLFNLDSISKGIGIQLSFPSVAPLLKNIDVAIPKDDIQEFLVRGSPLWQQRQSQSGDMINTPQIHQTSITGPFTAALSTYLSNHVAMDLNNPGISVSKIAIGPFALGGDGKVKVLASSSPAVDFWDSLVEVARDSRIGGPKQAAIKGGAEDTTVQDTSMQEDEEGEENETIGFTRPKPTHASVVPNEPPPPYELHDPARSEIS